MSQATPAQGTTQQPTPVCLLLKFNSGQQPLQAGALGLRVPSSWPLNQGWWPLPRWPAHGGSCGRGILQPPGPSAGLRWASSLRGRDSHLSLLQINKETRLGQ